MEKLVEVFSKVKKDLEIEVTEKLDKVINILSESNVELDPETINKLQGIMMESDEDSVVAIETPEEIEEVRVTPLTTLEKFKARIDHEYDEELLSENEINTYKLLLALVEVKEELIAVESFEDEEYYGELDEQLENKYSTGIIKDLIDSLKKFTEEGTISDKQVEVFEPTVKLLFTYVGLNEDTNINENLSYLIEEVMDVEFELKDVLGMDEDDDFDFTYLIKGLPKIIETEKVLYENNPTVKDNDQYKFNDSEFLENVFELVKLVLVSIR